MTAHKDPELLMTLEDRQHYKRKGFTACVMIARPVSVRSVGACEALFRSLGDAKRFATALNKMYGQGCYKGVNL